MKQLYLWREQSAIEIPPATLIRRLDAGDDVEGLLDLPVRDMLDQIKAHFPGGREGAGTWSWRAGEEAIESTWTWQYLRFDVEQLTDEHREKILEVARQFDCPVYDAAMNLRMGATGTQG